MYKPTASSYFSGSGLMDLGLQEAGVNVVKSLEIDPKCIETLRLNFSHQIDTRDIRQITVKDQVDTDIIVGTYPCTKYSAIANIKGMQTGDDLYLHFFRHLALMKPQAYVVENVPGMKKFPLVMEAMTKLPDYYVQVFCPLATTHWLPQRRDRLILIGTRKQFSISPPKGTRAVTLKEIVESAPDMKIPHYVLQRIKGTYRDTPIISDPSNNDLAPTCVAHYAKDLGTRMVVDKTHPLGIRPYTVREWARLQGVPDWFKFSGEGFTDDPYRQIGNGVPVPMARWIGEQMIRYFN